MADLKPDPVIDVFDPILNWGSWVPAVVGAMHRIGDGPWMFRVVGRPDEYSAADEGQSWRRRPDEYARGVAEERARVVAWMRLQADYALSVLASPPSYLAGANAIERGDHEKEGG